MPDELIERLEQIRQWNATIAKLSASIANAKELREQSRAAALALLRERGLKSARTDVGTATIGSRLSVRVVDHAACFKALEAAGQDAVYYCRVDARLVESYLKSTGEVLAGVEAAPVEYLSFREPRPAPPLDDEDGGRRGD